MKMVTIPKKEYDQMQHDLKIARLRERMHECLENMKTKTYTLQDIDWYVEMKKSKS